jgi:uncharacterized protein DUF927
MSQLRQLLARKSTYLAFAIGVALIAPLPSYIRLFRREEREVEDLLSETAVFNFSGESGSGKSSVERAAMSLIGSHHRSGTFDCSRRGLAEMASDSNDLLLVLDDTENAENGADVLVKTLKGIVHMVPGGRSKKISRGVDQTRFPDLRWSSFMLFEYSLSGKWLELLKQIASGVKRAAILRDPSVSVGIGQFAVIQAVAPSLGVDVKPVNIQSPDEIERAVASIARSGNGGMVVTASALAGVHRDLITMLFAAGADQIRASHQHLWAQQQSTANPCTGGRSQLGDDSG